MIVRLGELKIGSILSMNQNPSSENLAFSTPCAHGAMDVELQINGAWHDLQIEPRVSLLDALREFSDLPGTKKGGNQGACGA